MENEARGKKPDLRIISELRSDEERVVLKTLHILKSKSHINYLPELLKLLNRTGSELIKKELIRFIADSKEADAVPYILAGLRNPDLAAVHCDIVSACWQSGLDYSAELELFIRLFLEGDYRTALESFTVIEESVINLGEQEIEKARKLLLGGQEHITEEKKPLATELVKLLQT